MERSCAVPMEGEMSAPGEYKRVGLGGMTSENHYPFGAPIFEAEESRSLSEGLLTASQGDEEWDTVESSSKKMFPIDVEKDATRGSFGNPLSWYCCRVIQEIFKKCLEGRAEMPYQESYSYGLLPAEESNVSYTPPRSMSIKRDGGEEVPKSEATNSQEVFFTHLKKERKPSFSGRAENVFGNPQQQETILKRLEELVQGEGFTPNQHKKGVSFSSIVSARTRWEDNPTVATFYHEVERMEREELKKLSFLPPLLESFKKYVTSKSELLIDQGDQGINSRNFNLLLRSCDNGLKQRISDTQQKAKNDPLSSQEGDKKKILVDRISNIELLEDSIEKLLEERKKFLGTRLQKFRVARSASEHPKYERNNITALEKMLKGARVEKAILQSGFDHTQIRYVRTEKIPKELSPGGYLLASDHGRRRFFKRVDAGDIEYHHLEELGFDSSSKSEGNILNREMAAHEVAKLLHLTVPHHIPALYSTPNDVFFGVAPVYIEGGMHLHQDALISLNNVYQENPELLLEEIVQMDATTTRESLSFGIGEFLCQRAELPQDWMLEVEEPLQRVEVHGERECDKKNMILLPDGSLLTGEQPNDLTTAWNYFKQGKIILKKRMLVTVPRINLSDSGLQQAFANMQLFDLLINNPDRHMSNIMIGYDREEKKWRFYQFDHALAFGIGKKGGANKLLSDYREGVLDSLTFRSGNACYGKIPAKMPQQIDAKMAEQLLALSPDELVAVLAQAKLGNPEVEATLERLGEIQNYLRKVQNNQVPGARFVNQWNEQTYQEATQAVDVMQLDMQKGYDNYLAQAVAEQAWFRRVFKETDSRWFPFFPEGSLLEPLSEEEGIDSRVGSLEEELSSEPRSSAFFSVIGSEEEKLEY